MPISRTDPLTEGTGRGFTIQQLAKLAGILEVRRIAQLDSVRAGNSRGQRDQGWPHRAPRLRRWPRRHRRRQGVRARGADRPLGPARGTVVAHADPLHPASAHLHPLDLAWQEPGAALAAALTASVLGLQI